MTQEKNYERVNWQARKTPLSAANLNRMDEAIYRLAQAMYPVGSLYLTTSDHNPQDIFGGTWVAYAQGRALVGVGKPFEESEFAIQAEEEVGQPNITLAIENIPAHTHNVVTAANGTAEAGTIIQRGYQASTSVLQKETTTAGAKNPTPVDLIQPSIGVYVWKRTA